MLNFLKSILTKRKVIKEEKKLKKNIKEIRKYIGREQCVVITRQKIFTYNFTTWSEMQEKLSRVRLVKMDNFDDFIKIIDDLK